MAQGSRVTRVASWPGDQAQQSHLQPSLSALKANKVNVQQNRPQLISFPTTGGIIFCLELVQTQTRLTANTTTHLHLGSPAQKDRPNLHQ